MTFMDGKTKKSRSSEFEQSVAKFFDENGTLCFDIFAPEVEKLKVNLGKSKKE